jgi:hypothetical protein
MVRTPPTLKVTKANSFANGVPVRGGVNQDEFVHFWVVPDPNGPTPIIRVFEPQPTMLMGGYWTTDIRKNRVPATVNFMFLAKPYGVDFVHKIALKYNGITFHEAEFEYQDEMVNFHEITFENLLFRESQTLLLEAEPINNYGNGGMVWPYLTVR